MGWASNDLSFGSAGFPKSTREVSQTQNRERFNVRVLYCFSISFTTCSQLLRSDPGVPSPFIQHSRARIGSFGTERDRLVVAVAGSGVPELLAREDSRVLMA